MTRAVFVLLVVGTWLGGSLCACSSTRDVGRPAAGQGTAIIVPENQFNRMRAAGPFTPQCATGQVLVRICGQALDQRRQFRVPAGPRTLDVAFVDDEAPAERGDSVEDLVLKSRAVRMTFDAQAGHTYAVRGRARWSGMQPSVTLWIVDGADGRTVTSVAVPRENLSVESLGFSLGE